MRTTLRSAVLTLAAAVVLPVVPAVVTAPAASAAPKPAAASASVDWLVRDARAKTTIAHLAARRAQAAQRAYLRAATVDLEPRRAAADHARRHAKATATIAHLARRKADAAQRPVQPRASRSASRPAPAAPAGVWDRLAQCESGGNWKISTGNGYYGGIQFSLSSWRAVGGSGYPHQASRAEQIRRGELLKAKQGWGAWPACTRKLGLR